MQKVFIAGCGYIGERVARRFRESGHSVTCMVRSPEHAEKLRADGFKVFVSVLDDPDVLPELDLTDTILFYLVPPPGGGIVDVRARNFITTPGRSGKPAKIIYMSATSVYSEAGGKMVTEESPASPDSSMGKRRLDAEKAFLEFGLANDVPVVILRVSGIYGLGRLPLMQISQGQPVLNEEESGPSNRIHADDLAEICIAAAKRGRDGDVFNVSDGNPCSMTTYFNACADILGFPRQPQIPLSEAREAMSPLMYSYVSQSRIIVNDRMLKQLKVSLQYPTLSEGLAASIRSPHHNK